MFMITLAAEEWMWIRWICTDLWSHNLTLSGRDTYPVLFTMCLKHQPLSNMTFVYMRHNVHQTKPQNKFCCCENMLWRLTSESIKYHLCFKMFQSKIFTMSLHNKFIALIGFVHLMLAILRINKLLNSGNLPANLHS